MAELKRFKTAVIGCGVISEIYLKNLCQFFKIIDVVGCSDLLPERSKQRAEQFGIRQMTNEEIYSDPEIEIVVNLTYPLSHYEVTKAALLAGKHVYSEKMIAVTLEEGEELLALARSKNLQLTIAPDTCLGGGIQTARWIVDSGMIGDPIMVSGFCPRSYQLTREDDAVRMIHLPGGGIPFDMGGYYLHAFVNLFGPVSRASGFARIRAPHRTYLNPQSPLYGDEFEETCINTMSAALEFESGVLGSLLVTSECTSNAVQKIEVMGTEGMLSIHDPNNFGGPLTVKRTGNPEPLTIPYTHAFYDTDRRGIGVADMAYAIKNGRRPRLDGALGLHAFEIIHRVWSSTTTGKTYTIKNQVQRPAAMPRTPFGGTCAEHVLDL